MSYAPFDDEKLFPDISNITNAHIGKRVFIGSHAVILNGKKVGDDAFVCAGSIVFSNVTVGVQADKADTTAAGVDVIPTFDGTGLASAKTVYWDDNHGSTLLPTGLETVTRYNDQSAN